MKEPVRVCQAASSATSIYHLLRGQIQALEAAGCEVTALSGRDEFSLKAANCGIQIDIAPMVRELSPFRDLSTLIWLVRYLKRGHFDIVHTHTPKAGLLIPLAARIAGVPCVFHTVHGFLFHDRMRKPRWLAGWLAEKFTSLWVDGLLFQSQEDCDNAPRLHIVPRDRCFYIGNGVEVNRYLSADGDARVQARALLNIPVSEFVIGFAGRLVREKGIEDLLRSVEQFISGKERIRLVVVGALEEDDQSDSLRAADLDNWQHRLPVMFLGYREDLHRLFSAMDVFVLPSYREGLPRALTEASLAGVPMIATDIRGNREVVQHQVSGLLYPPGDLDGLLNALEDVYSHPESALERAKRAQRNSVERFDETAVTRRIVAVYRHFVPCALGANPDAEPGNA
jgi:glycosyltransferase involved in cell wall biosynthesis